ncbi:MAG: SPOR domain-containing protein [Gammaproteobacteria bacterium]|nr:SPOR domain-containing protein [Gammaproteobacteria bacterium]MBU1656353.1 SPOR domain-containing protein [Gammaproteobacteria bacterium]MBU1959917.1 SPOR domain-containing protein [Gammaproteobacteria bacterium]
MARDYNSQARRRHNQSPPWLWFFAGALVGALGASLAWIKQGGITVETPVAVPVAKAPAATPPPPARVEPEPEAPKPRFDFYTVLPEQEVVIPEQEIAKPAPAAAAPAPPQLITPATTATPQQSAESGFSRKPQGGEAQGSAEQKPAAEPAGAAVFMLQMGSFRNYNDADRLKASLGLLGIRADIQSVTVSGPSGQNTVHRVRGGPYSRAQAQSLHETLKAYKTKSIFIRIQQ